MITVTVKITNLPNVQARLSRLGESLNDWSAMFASLATTLIAFFSETVFVSEGGALGETWRPLAPSTLAEKTAKWPGRGIEVRTGAMQQSFYPEITPFSLFIGNRASYFPFQQLGTSAGSGRGHNIPARKMLGVNTTVEGIIRTEVEAGVRAKIDETEL